MILTFIECPGCQALGKRLVGEDLHCQKCGSNTKPIPSFVYNLKLLHGGADGA
jgi:hypothetical protein